jgi:GNAT superfamily N-acetyltransferase
LIRTVHVEEFPDFMRFLERTYGLATGFFERVYPERYRPTAEACSCFYVLEQDGRIVSHVGLFPIHAVTAGVSVTMGGIGGVGTHPQERGKGYMTQLLQHVIGVMREREYPLSCLGGDRQRYNTFGWERAGVAYELTFTPRSLDRQGVQPESVQEVHPWEALGSIVHHRSQLACRAHQPALELQLHKAGLRAWIAPDGYALTNAPAWDKLDILELASASGNEAGIVRALLKWTSLRSTTWSLSCWDRERLARVMPASSGWRVGSGWMFRIVNLYRLFAAAQETIARRAANLRELQVSIQIDDIEHTEAVTLSVHRGTLEIAPGASAPNRIALTPVQAARLLLGGPPIAPEGQIPAGLEMLLPIPAHTPQMEDV